MSTTCEPNGLTDQEIEDAAAWARETFQDLRDTVAAGEAAFVAHHIEDMQSRTFRSIR